MNWKHFEMQSSGVPGPQVSYRVEQSHQIDGGLIEIRRYLWSQSLEEGVRGPKGSLVLNMAVTSRPERTRVERITPGTEPSLADAGRLLVMMPGTSYHLSAPRGAFRSLHCAIDCARFEAVLGEPIDWASLSGLGGELRSGIEIERLLLRIRDELAYPQIGRDALIEASVTALCVELCRRFRQGRPKCPNLHAGGLAAWRMRLLVDRIHADAPAPRVTELAELCGLTTRQLSRTFKAETGMTIGRYVDEATMERAHRLLTTSALTIAGIAHELGFAGPDSFAQSYRRVTGIAPSRARIHHPL